MLTSAFIVVISLFGVIGSTESLRRASDPCDTPCSTLFESCTSATTCPCTTAIEQAAQTCLTCVTTSDSSLAAAVGLDPATLASQFNSKCSASGISVTLPQSASTGSAVASGGASAPITTGAASTPISGATPTAASSAGAATANPPSQSGSAGSNQSSGGGRVAQGGPIVVVGGLFISLMSWEL